MHIVIIGNGITGSTVARHVRKHSDHKITMISAETKYFFSRTALMYVYMGHMKPNDLKPYENWFWDKNRIDLLHTKVERVDTKAKILSLQDGSELHYDKLVLATGSKYNKYGWPGQDLKGVGGLYAWQDLQYMEYYTQKIKHAVIVGGGLIGIEMAEMLHSRGIGVTLLVREKSYWNNVLPPEESEMISRHIIEHGIDLRLGEELKEILPDDDGRVRAIITKGGEEIACQYVGLTAGVSPNVAFLKEGELEVDRGIVVNEYMETNIPDVFAAGDCAQFSVAFPDRRPIEQVWYTGKIQAEALALTLTKERTAYEPGIWFNSAKFFDIEYQVYGQVPAAMPDDWDSLYWEYPKGDKSIRIVHDRTTLKVVGFNVMGIRYRHAVCDKWLNEAADLETVLKHLGAANFDPEFYKEYEQDLIDQYQQKTGKHIELKRKRSLKGALELLMAKARG